MAEIERPEEATLVPAGPTPMSWTIGTDAVGRIVVQVRTAVGEAVYFLDRDGAKGLAKVLDTEASKSGSLIVPLGVDVGKVLGNGHKDPQ